MCKIIAELQFYKHLHYVKKKLNLLNYEQIGQVVNWWSQLVNESDSYLYPFICQMMRILRTFCEIALHLEYTHCIG